MANVKNYRKQGGDEWVINGELTVTEDGKIKLNGVELTAESLGIMDALAGFDFTIESGATNKCEVTIQAEDAEGENLERVVMAIVWLSDDDAGLGLTDNTVDDLDAKDGEGEVIGTLTDDKALVIQTKADGSFILEIEDDGKDECYVGAVSWGGFAHSVSDQVEAGDYGNA